MTRVTTLRGVIKPHTVKVFGKWYSRYEHPSCGSQMLWWRRPSACAGWVNQHRLKHPECFTVENVDI